MMIVSLCLSAQNVNDLISEKTKDVAYSAPNTMFVNKKWLSFSKDFEILNTYHIFKANKTGEFVKQKKYADCSFEIVIPFSWSRNHNNLTISLKFKSMTYRKIVYKDPSLSERKKASIKEGVEDIIKDEKNKVRVLDSYIIKYYINRLDAKLFLLEGLSVEVKGLGRTQTDRCDDLFLCTEAGKKGLEDSKKKEEEEKEKAEEEAKKKNEEQATEVIRQEDKIYDVVEQMPQFPGGPSAMMQWISNNINYPIVAKENNVQGRVTCTFVVERDGSITNVRVINSVDPSLDKEAVRLLNAMPNWSPDKQNGSPVRVKYTVPVTFRL